MEEKRIENFIREFERQMFWKKFREEALFVILRFISFFLTLCCIGSLLLFAIESKTTDEIKSFLHFFLIVFTFYALLNTNFFEKRTIEEINVPEFEKFLEDKECIGMEIDRKIVEEFLLNKETMEEVEEVTTEEAEEVITAEIINF